MAIYKVEITEYLKREIEVEADSKSEAYWKAKDKYNNEEVVLDASDYDDVDFKVKGKKELDMGER